MHVIFMFMTIVYGLHQICDLYAVLRIKYEMRSILLHTQIHIYPRKIVAKLKT